MSLDAYPALVWLVPDTPIPSPIFDELCCLLEPRFENLTPLHHELSRFRSLGLRYIGVLVLVLKSNDAEWE